MSDPLDEKPQLLSPERFSFEAVTKFRNQPDEIAPEDRKHYNQLRTTFDIGEIRSALEKFEIGLQTTATVYGGYTGEFADCLSKIGMRVIFTDPLTEWVEAAKGRGLEAYRMSVQEIPKSILQRTDLFASFECFPDLIGNVESQYANMRLLTVRYGIFFVESKATVESMKENQNPDSTQELGTFRRWFRPLNSVYGIKRIARKGSNLNFYHIFAETEARERIALDLRVMKSIYESFPNDQIITLGEARPIALGSDLTESEVKVSLERLAALSDSIHLPYKKIFPFLLTQEFKGDLPIGSKRVYIRL